MTLVLTSNALDTNPLTTDLALLSSPDMERACLSCLLVKPDLLIDVDVDLTEQDFTISHHKILYGILRSIFQTYLQTKATFVFDAVSILNQIKMLGIEDEYLSSSKGVEYLESLKAAVGLSDLGNFSYYVGIVKSFSTKRTLYLESTKIKKDLLENRQRDVEEILVETENRFLAIHLQGTAMGIKTIQLGDQVEEKIRELFAHPAPLVGTSTGFQMLDSQTLGLRKESLTILAARYKDGKSAFLENIGLNIAKQQIPVYMISTEMSDWEVQLRAISNLSNIEVSKIETGMCSEEEQQRVFEATKQLTTLPFFHLHILDFSPERVVSLMRRFVYQKVGFDEQGKTKPCVVLFDYMKMPEMQRNARSFIEHEWQALGVFCTILKNAASQLGIAIVTAAQINEEGGVAASARLKWFSTGLWQWSSYERELSEEQKIKIDKSKWQNVYRLRILLGRHGPENLIGIPFRFDKPLMQIEEAPNLVFSS